MSQTTPYLGNKRTPGTMTSDPPSQPNSGMMTDQSPGAAPPLNASRSVTDRFAANSKQLLNAYIYEFLVKNTLSETAKSFVLEADVPTVAYDSRHSSSKTSPILLSTDGPDKDANGNASVHSTPQTPALTVSQFSEEHNIPNLSLTMEAPQGFLYEWWQVFWDVHNVENNKQASAAASQYHQMQLMKSNQQPDLNSINMAQLQLSQQNAMLNIFPNIGPPGPMQARPNGSVVGMPMGQPAPNGQIPAHMLKKSVQVDPRQQMQMMQLMMKQAQASASASQSQPPTPGPHVQNQPQLQPQRNHSAQSAQSVQSQPARADGPNGPLHRPGANGPAMDQSMNSPMFMPNGQNRNQQQAQTQMNNLRQQAGVAQASGQGPAAAAVAAVAAAASAAAAANPQSINTGSPAMNGARANAVRTMRPGPSPNGSGKQMYQQLHPQQQQLLQQQQQQILQQRLPQQQMPQQMSQQMPQQMSQQMPQQQMPPQMQNMQPGMPQPVNMPPGNMQHPQMQQMSQTQQNVFGMPPSPYGQQNMAVPAPPVNPNVQPGRNMNALQDYQMQLMLLEKQNKKRLDIARFNVGGDNTMPQQAPAGHAANSGSPAPSPHPSSKPSPVIPASKQKKTAASKRPRKLSVNSTTPQSAGPETGANGRAATKKKPSPEPEAAKKRKKGAESPKKGTKASALKKDKPKAKKEDKDDDRPQASEGKMQPPNAFYNQPLADRVPTDILGNGGAGNGVNFFTSGGNSSIDDIDFDFNSFLDGGDDGMSGGLSGFNWGNSVEGE